MPPAFVKREVKSPKLLMKFEVEFNNSTLTAQEAVDRISSRIHGPHCREFSEFIVFLLRETKSSTFEIKKLEID